VVVPMDGLRSDPSNLIRVMPAEEARGRQAAYLIVRHACPSPALFERRVP
jgi:hypothetical protein